MDTPRKLDLYTDAELMSAFWAYFGGRRAVTILGWCAVGAASGAESPGELLRRLEARGLSRSALYQNLDALRDFQEHIEGQPLPRQNTSPSVSLMMRLSAIPAM